MLYAICSVAHVGHRSLRIVRMLHIVSTMYLARMRLGTAVVLISQTVTMVSAINDATCEAKISEH